LLEKEKSMSSSTPVMPTMADIMALIDRLVTRLSEGLREDYDKFLAKEDARRAEENARREKERAEENARREAELAKEAARREKERTEENARREAELAKEATRKEKERAEESVRREKERTEENTRRAANAEELREWREEWKDQSKKLHKKMGTLDHNIGKFSENITVNGLKKKFEELGYPHEDSDVHIPFVIPGSRGISSEIDYLYESTDAIILVEFKAALEVEDVKKHMERIEKYRRCINAAGDNRKIMGAVHGAVVGEGAREFSLENGLYVVEHSGDSIQIIEPEKEKLKKW